MTRAAAGCLAAGTLAAALWGQDFALFHIDLVAKGHVFTQGPAWSRQGFLIFSDTPSDQLLRWTPGREPVVFREDAHGPCGNAFDSEGRLYTCESRARRVTRTEKDGAVTVVAERWEGKRLNAPAQIAISRNDRVYFTDPAFSSQSEHRELDFYGVYHLPPHGPMKLLARLSTRPTGIALSPNGRVLYVANADERTVTAYELDRAGDVTGQRVLVSGIDGVPGGMSTDEKGNLYLAARGVAVYSPEGKLLHTIPTHEGASNCAFGEADGKSLFITARTNVYRVRTDAKPEN
ncbi:MAG: SMP-30/gluconolactonase/LRE family protein [Bryobacteraceae bacterium]|jgi:gluconolactonase